MHSDSDSNPYDNNAPIPNPYETPGYGAPPPDAKPDNYAPPQPPPYSTPQQGNQYPPQPPPYPPQQQGNQYPPQQYPYPAPGNQYPPSQGSAPTVYGPYSQQPGGGAQNAPYQYANAPLPQYSQGNQPPTKRTSSGLRIAVLVIVALIIIFAVIAAIAIPAHNTQVANANATATAQANVHGTATAQANASITATALAKTNATATAAASTYPFSSNLQFNDPLSDNSRGNGWEESANCTFTSGAYHDIDNTTNTISPCSALKSGFKDFTYQASMQFKKGSLGGITFRGNTAQWHYYSFIVGNDGSFGLLLYTKPDTKPQTLHEGNAQFNANQPIQLGVVARGNTITLYINKQQVATINDSTYTSGQIGVVAYNTGDNADVAFTNAQVWGL
jgi:Tfp pilus assembly protein PilE